MCLASPFYMPLLKEQFKFCLRGQEIKFSSLHEVFKFIFLNKTSCLLDTNHYSRSL